MPRSDPEFWNRRTSAATIWTNLRWTFVHIWAHGRAPALGLVAVQILLGIQPALLIYITQHLIDTVVASAGEGGVGFEQTLPWLIAFGLVLLLTSDVLWQIRDALHLRLEQNLEHALGRRFLAKASRLPLVFFEVSAFYDRLERAKNPGRTVDRFFFAAMHLFQAGIRVLSIAAMFAPVSLWISLTLLIVLVPQIRLAIEQSRRFMSFTYGQTEEMRRAGNVDLNQADRNGLWDQSAAVFQDYTRFAFSLGENIGLGRTEQMGDQAAVQRAAHQGGAAPIAEQLPEHYHTLLTKEFAGGTELSGGEWQRVAISRGFMRNAALIVLDEPTASLDPQAEADVFRRFLAMSGERTTIVVSHRLGSARLCDRILVLKEGRLLENGTHGELLSQGGEYARLWALQAQWYGEGEGGR